MDALLVLRQPFRGRSAGRLRGARAKFQPPNMRQRGLDDREDHEARRRRASIAFIGTLTGALARWTQMKKLPWPVPRFAEPSWRASSPAQSWSSRARSDCHSQPTELATRPAKT